MKDDATNLDGPTAGPTNAPNLPTAVDRATFQAELDRLASGTTSGRRQHEAAAAQPTGNVELIGQEGRLVAMSRLRYQLVSAIPGGTTATTAAAVTATLGAAAACSVIAIDQTRGMDMGVATRLGSFGFFAASWVSMMGAMMLPGAVPGLLRRTHASGRLLAAPVFAVWYIAVWAVVGVAVYALYRPHGTVGRRRRRDGSGRV